MAKQGFVSTDTTEVPIDEPALLMGLHLEPNCKKPADSQIQILHKKNSTRGSIGVYRAFCYVGVLVFSWQFNHSTIQPLKDSTEANIPKHILPLIVLGQFCGTCLWFAGNAVIPDLSAAFHLGPKGVANLTSAVQFGFIVGTLVFAFFNIPDRFAPRRVFLLSSMLGGVFNAMIVVLPGGQWSLLFCRFFTGFFLAGIYPVGMKIAADWYQRGLGKALGYLVGALVLGTAFPHLLRGLGANWSWQTVLATTSIIAASGGFLLFLLVPDGPHRVHSAKLELNAFARIFAVPNFRSAAFGYFGHMWELYAFWAFVPVMIQSFFGYSEMNTPTSLWSFHVIAIGALGCILGGYIALSKGSSWVAFRQLTISGICCLTAFACLHFSQSFFLIYLLLWGLTVVGDSPQFSTLVAQTAPKKYIGTALTITNCIGFSITIVSIQLIDLISLKINLQNALVILALGPLAGLWSLSRLKFDQMGNTRASL